MSPGNELDAPATDPPAHRSLERASVVLLGCTGAFAATSIAGLQIALGMLLLLFLFGWSAGWIRRIPSLLDGAGVLHLATLALSILFAVFPDGGHGERYNLWRFLLVVALLHGLATSRTAARTAVLAFVATLGLVAIYAIVQSRTGIDLLRTGGRAVHVAADLAPGWYRPTGTFNWYSTLAFVLGIGLCLTAGLVVERAIAPISRLLLAGTMVPMGIALALTQVRAVYLGVALGLLVIAAHRGRRHALGIMATLAGMVAALAIASPPVRLKLQHFVDLGYLNNRDRIFMWLRALEMLADHPATGVGHGGYLAATEWYYDRWNPEFPIRSHAHDDFLQFWVTAGPLALAAYLFLFVTFVHGARRAYCAARSLDDSFAAALASGGVGAVACVLIASFFQNPYFDGEVFYATCLAVGLGCAAMHWVGLRPLPWRSVLPPLAAIVGATGFSGLVGPTTWGGSSGGVGGPGGLVLGGAAAGLFLLARGQRGTAPPASRLFHVAIGLALVYCFMRPLGTYALSVHTELPSLLQATSSLRISLWALTPLLLAAGIERTLWSERAPPRLAAAGALCAILAVATAGPMVPVDPPEAPPAKLHVRTTVLAGRRCTAQVLSRSGLLLPPGCRPHADGMLTLSGTRFRCHRAAGLQSASWRLYRCRPSRWGHDLYDVATDLGPARPHALGKVTLDEDQDSIPDTVDGCMRFDPSQTDADRDGVTDACEPLTSITRLADGRFLAATSRGEAVEFDLITDRARVRAEALPVRSFRLAESSLSALTAIGFHSGGPLFAWATENPGRLTAGFPTGRTLAARAFGLRPGWVDLVALPPHRPGRPRTNWRLVAARRTAPRLFVVEPSERGSLRTLDSTYRAPRSPRIRRLQSLDLDQDGMGELVVLTEAPRRIDVFRVDTLAGGLSPVGRRTLAPLEEASPRGGRPAFGTYGGRLWHYRSDGVVQVFLLTIQGDGRIRLGYPHPVGRGPAARAVLQLGDCLYAYRIRDPAWNQVLCFDSAGVEPMDEAGLRRSTESAH